MMFCVADWHPVYSSQLARYRDLYPELMRLGAQLVTISADTVWSHTAFSHAHHLRFPATGRRSDPRGSIARAYGVYDARRQSTNRALFVIDATGTITWSCVFPDVVDPGRRDGQMSKAARAA
jgi:alkyl hydroperoxide reductase subunit AhpC